MCTSARLAKRAGDTAILAATAGASLSPVITCTPCGLRVSLFSVFLALISIEIFLISHCSCYSLHGLRQWEIVRACAVGVYMTNCPSALLKFPTIQPNVDPGLVGAERFILRCLLIRRDFSRRLSGAERLHLRSLLMRRDFSQTKYILIYNNVIRKGLPLHRFDHRRLACVRSLRGHGGLIFLSGPTMRKG